MFNWAVEIIWVTFKQRPSWIKWFSRITQNKIHLVFRDEINCLYWNYLLMVYLEHSILSVPDHHFLHVKLSNIIFNQVMENVFLQYLNLTMITKMMSNIFYHVRRDWRFFPMYQYKIHIGQRKPEIRYRFFICFPHTNRVQQRITRLHYSFLICFLFLLFFNIISITWELIM